MWKPHLSRTLNPFNRTLEERLFWLMQILFVYRPTRDYYKSHLCEETGCSSEKTDLNQRNFKSSPEKRKSKCDGQDSCLPEEPRWLDCYTKLTTLVHVYSVFQSTLLIIILNPYLGLDSSWNCYILGRLTIHESSFKLIPYFQFLSSTLLLLWRYIIAYIDRKYRLDCVVFLGTSKQKLGDLVSAEFDVRFDRNSPPDPWLERMLYMEIPQSDGGNLLFLRPNRIMRTYRELSKFFDRFFVLIVVATTSLTGLMFPFILRTVLLDLYFIQVYPTCMPDLEQLAEDGKLPWWSFSVFDWPPNYRLLTLPFDVLINLVVWLEDMAALLVPATFAVLFSEDLVIYWRDLSRRLDELLYRMKNSISFSQANGFNSHPHPHYLIHGPMATMMQEFTESRGQARANRIDMEIFILQQQIIDFFTQLKHYNKYVSLVASFFFLSWSVLFMASSYFAATSESMTLVMLIRILQVYGLVAILAPLYALLRIRTRTKRSYPIIASIMSFERDPARQGYWSQILEHYTDKPFFGFTLINLYPITWLSYLNLVASSVSFLVVLDTYWILK